MTNNNQITFNESKNVQYVFIQYKNEDYTITINNNAETLTDLFNTPLLEDTKQYKTEFHTVTGKLLFVHVYEFIKGQQFGKPIAIKVINMDLITDIEVIEK